MITDTQRDRLAAGLALAAGTIYLARANQIRAKHRKDVLPALPYAVRRKVNHQATTRAAAIQTSANVALARADASTSKVTKEDAIATLRRRARDLIVPSVGLWALNHATIDTHREIGTADATLWRWTQNTDFPDACGDADAASPTSLDELLDIAGGPPQTHPGCLCSLEPADTAF